MLPPRATYQRFKCGNKSHIAHFQYHLRINGNKLERSYGNGSKLVAALFILVNFLTELLCKVLGPAALEHYITTMPSDSIWHLKPQTTTNNYAQPEYLQITTLFTPQAVYLGADMAFIIDTECRQDLILCFVHDVARI